MAVDRLLHRLGYSEPSDGGYVVLARGEEQRLAIVVDDLVGQRELVTRPLPPQVGNRLALSGGAVLADGSIALIVDCDALADRLTRTPTLVPAATSTVAQTLARAA